VGIGLLPLLRGGVRGLVVDMRNPVQNPIDVHLVGGRDNAVRKRVEVAPRREFSRVKLKLKKVLGVVPHHVGFAAQLHGGLVRLCEVAQAVQALWQLVELGVVKQQGFQQVPRPPGYRQPVGVHLLLPHRPRQAIRLSVQLRPKGRVFQQPVDQEFSAGHWMISSRHASARVDAGEVPVARGI